MKEGSGKHYCDGNTFNIKRKLTSVGRENRVGISVRNVSPGPKYKIDLGLKKPCNLFARDEKLKNPKTESPSLYY